MVFKRNKIAAKSGEKLAGIIAGALLGSQRRISSRVNTQLARLEKRGKMLFMAGVVTLLGGFSLFTIVFSFNDEEPRLAKPWRVVVPKYIEERFTPLLPTIHAKDMEQIVLFKNYLDSLRRDSHGRYFYDSLRRHRPGLLDSLTLMQSYYHSNVK